MRESGECGSARGARGAAASLPEGAGVRCGRCRLKSREPTHRPVAGDGKTPGRCVRACGERGRMAGPDPISPLTRAFVPVERPEQFRAVRLRPSPKFCASVRTHVSARAARSSLLSVRGSWHSRPSTGCLRRSTIAYSVAATAGLRTRTRRANAHASRCGHAYRTCTPKSRWRYGRTLWEHEHARGRATGD
jgi:hypothetical protein